MSCDQKPIPATDAPVQEIGEPPANPTSVPAVNSADLLRGHRVLLIHHGGETYRLRLTKTGKLILNK